MARTPIIKTWPDGQLEQLLAVVANGSTRQAAFLSFGIPPRTYQNYMARGREYRDEVVKPGGKPKAADKFFFELLEDLEKAEAKAELGLVDALYSLAVGEARGKVKISYPLGRLQRLADEMNLGKRPKITEVDALVDWLEAVATHEEAPSDLAVELEAWTQKDPKTAQYLLGRRFGSRWGKTVLDEEGEKASSAVFL